MGRPTYLAGSDVMKSFVILVWFLVFFFMPRLLSAQGSSPEQLLLKDFKPRSIYHVPVTSVTKARFPVIDIHTHDYAKTDEQLAQWVRTMDELGIQKSV